MCSAKIPDDVHAFLESASKDNMGDMKDRKQLASMCRGALERLETPYERMSRLFWGSVSELTTDLPLDRVGLPE